MSICFICKYFVPVHDDNAKSTSLNGCNAPVGRRHWLLRKIFGNKYTNIFAKEFLYPCDEHSDCSYYKKKIIKYNIGAL